MVRLQSFCRIAPRAAATWMLLLSGVAGLACSATATAAASFSLSPAAMDYGDQTLFTQRTQSVWLKNTGTVPLDLTSVAVVGTDSALFTHTHTCGSSVAVATTCRIYVTFRPTAVGAKSAALRVVASAITRTTNMTGTGVLAQFSLTPTSLSFGSVAVNTISAAQPVTVRNTGTGILPIQSIKLGGTNPGQFADIAQLSVQRRGGRDLQRASVLQAGFDRQQVRDVSRHTVRWGLPEVSCAGRPGYEHDAGRFAYGDEQFAVCVRTTEGVRLGSRAVADRRRQANRLVVRDGRQAGWPRRNGGKDLQHWPDSRTRALPDDLHES